MKLLAAVTIILTVPTIVFGLWGTNVPVPFEHSPFGFAIVLGLGLLGGAYYMAVTISNALSAFTWFFVAVLMVIAGTYLRRRA